MGFISLRRVKSLVELITKKMRLKDAIVFECESDFQDNPREFYNYLISEKINKHTKLIWLVNNPRKIGKVNKIKNTIFLNRHKHSWFNTFKLLYYLNTSRWFVFSHPYWFLNWREGQIVINTTHSISQLKDSSGTLAEKHICDYVVCSSEYCREIRKKTFGMENENYIVTGLPRIDTLAKENDKISLFLKETSDQKIIISMETFKQSIHWHDSKADDKYAINVIDREEDLRDFDVFLQNNNLKMIIKIHHLQNMDFIDLVELNNIIYLSDEDLIDKDVQVNELLYCADILLTDYSSVFYDYLILDRPIGFMIKDINEYDRGFITDDPLTEMPGEIIHNYSELKSFLIKTLNGEDNYKEQREIIKNKVFKYNDFNNSKRLYEWMCGRK